MIKSLYYGIVAVPGGPVKRRLAIITLRVGISAGLKKPLYYGIVAVLGSLVKRRLAITTLRVDTDAGTEKPLHHTVMEKLLHYCVIAFPGSPGNGRSSIPAILNVNVLQNVLRKPLHYTV